MLHAIKIPSPSAAINIFPTLDMEAAAVSYMLKHKLKLDFSKAATIEDNMFT